MPAEAPENIRTLVKKYLDGTITPEEEIQLNTWYNDNTGAGLVWPKNETGVQLRERMFAAISKENTSEPALTTVTLPAKKWIGRAAAVSIGIMLLTGFYIWRKQPGYTIVKQDEPVTAANAGVAYTRYIKLPDGSTVLLHANSTLEYPAAFRGPVREVKLKGEAYFDVAHNSSQPFIILTGKVKTTVLGTAFNIKAYEDSSNITVSVTRGKVRVEDDQAVLAELLADQQVVYNIPSHKASQENFVQLKALDEWMKEELSFDGESFSSIAAVLDKRYSVTVQFKNPALKKCTIKAFFEGTEPLEKILERLCLISNARYTRSGHYVYIDGEGCN